MNVTKTMPKCLIAYFYSICIVGPMGFWMVLRYLNKYRAKSMEIRYEQDSDSGSVVSVIDERRPSILISMRDLQKDGKLLEDRDLNQKFYSEFEIAEHTVMISGFPRDLPRIELEQGVKEMIDLIIQKENLTT